MKKPGEKSTVLWHIHELLSPDDVPVITDGIGTPDPDPRNLVKWCF